MRYSDKIRELLAQTPDGMTIRQIADHFRCHYDTIQRAMMNTWGVYIDRYTYSENGMLTKVFCVVDVPQDAPRPDVKRTHKPAEIRV